MISYPAIIHKESNCFWAEFPDLEGCFVQEETLEQLKNSCISVLSDFLESLDSRKINIPLPSSLSGENILFFTPNLNIAFAITLKQYREKLGWTQKEVAEKAGLSWAVYQKIENPRRSNPTLSTIGKIQTAMGISFLI